MSWFRTWHFWMRLHTIYILFIAGILAKILVFALQYVYILSYIAFYSMQSCTCTKHFSLCSIFIPLHNWCSPRLDSSSPVCPSNAVILHKMLCSWYFSTHSSMILNDTKIFLHVLLSRNALWSAWPQCEECLTSLLWYWLQFLRTPSHINEPTRRICYHHGLWIFT